MRSGVFFLGVCQLLVIVKLSKAATEFSISGQLPSNYNYVNVEQMLRIRKPSSSLLDLICPSKLTIRSTGTGQTFEVEIRREAGDDIRCHVEDGEFVIVPLQRAELKPDSREEERETLSLEETYNHFPLFLGNFSNHRMFCPAFELPGNVTSLAAHDTGYIYTILNQYRASKLALGESFDAVSKSVLADIQGTYTVTIFLHPDQELSCDYLRIDDIEKLRFIVEELSTTGSSPTQSASPLSGNTSSPAATPSMIPPASSPSSPGSNRTDSCFPGDTLAMLRNGQLIKMRHLQVGQVVLDSAGSFSKILFFSHADPHAVSEFVHILTDRADLVLSASHYVYANNEISPAGQIAIGDTVTTISKQNMATSSQQKVVQVDRRTLRGLFNPHTASGSIAVFWKRDGILASTYTTAVHPNIAHSLLAPLRRLEEKTGITLPLLSSAFRQGSKSLPSVFRALQNSIRADS